VKPGLTKLLEAAASEWAQARKAACEAGEGMTFDDLVKRGKLGPYIDRLAAAEAALMQIVIGL
jgi:hypothetical protein